MVRSLDELDGSEPPGEAIKVLVEAHGARIHALGRRFCGNVEDAEDLVQETFLQAFRKWDQFQGLSSPATWLYTIAYRVCQRFHRKRSGEPERLESIDELLPFAEERIGVVPEESDPAAEQIRAEGRERIEEAISDLPDEFRIPLLLKEIAGLSLQEIAIIMDLKPATVKTRVHRARLRIRQVLEGVLLRRRVPPATYSKQVCMDLLRAKQETLDRGVAFQFPAQVVCDRCAALFATLDLAQGLCGEIARGELPAGLRQALLEGLEA